MESGAREERSFWGPGDRYTFLVTGEESGGSMFALDCVVGVGGGPPPHRHLAEDELFYVFEGSISFTMGDETRVIGPGQSAFVPSYFLRKKSGGVRRILGCESDW